MTARILVVDDTEANVRLLSVMASQDYYEVATAINGPEALEKAAVWHPDVIILDVMMPGMDGYEVCRQLKRNVGTAQIPVIMVTALDGSAAKLRGLECGADDFLTRPIEAATTMARVRSLVRLKRLSDEWQARWETSHSLGLIEGDGPGAVSVEATRALLVDDWDLGAERITQALADEGISCMRAGDEHETLHCLRNVALDLVVINLSLGTGDPLRLASRLRAAPLGRDVPLLLVAEADQRDVILRGIDLGANDWIVRPLDINELRVRARNLIRRKLYQDRLRQDLDDAMRLALVDPLTGLYNRRYFRRHLDSQLAAEPFARVAVLLIDIDRFKEFNDRFGHAVGDGVLLQVARMMSEETRIVDLAARLGGEEFIIVIVGMSDEEIASVAARLRRRIDESRFDVEAARGLHVTVSVGVAIATVANTDGDALIRRADRALYAAKSAGRNCISMAP
ncbi:response regulator receiver modulated diguanylate cyclase [Arboricoccus pini]|uniref:diguanylate cyclase n=1 Tax=Arboricoccus pini TaxID=1963835 RepID=A0A212RN97_9PROT|nr:PleD family two-component system response regulator [Arboricoccus pini]SNB73892.1 response regulator receiver modulated diguanylate cyclase [Arboricoccus pini]